HNSKQNPHLIKPSKLVQPNHHHLIPTKSSPPLNRAISGSATVVAVVEVVGLTIHRSDVKWVAACGGVGRRVVVDGARMWLVEINGGSGSGSSQRSDMRLLLGVLGAPIAPADGSRGDGLEVVVRCGWVVCWGWWWVAEDAGGLPEMMVARIK
nr:hypothetical protein [Tanacetum cinerariifolium]